MKSPTFIIFTALLIGLLSAARAGFAIDEKALQLAAGKEKSGDGVVSDTASEVDELPYVSPPPPPLPDLRKLSIDRAIQNLVAVSGLPGRRQARLKRMVSGAYQSHEFGAFWEGDNPDIVIERISDSLRSHALDPFSIPDFASSNLTEGPIRDSPAVTVDDVRLTLQVAEASLLLKEGPATEKLIWELWNQGDTPGSIGTVEHTENLTQLFSDLLSIHRKDPENIVAGFVPTNWIYSRLRQAWLANSSNPNPAPIAFRGNAYRGKRYAQAGELASLLGMQGFIDPQNAAIATSSGIYTPELSAAVKDFQSANGLKADGILGPNTLDKLRRDPNRDRQSIVLNMHRARLIPNEPGRRYILVNLPSGELYGFHNQNLETRMRVVFGSNTEGRRTPIFRDTMEEVIFRPYWWVPKSIAVNEYLPRAYQDPSSLSRRGYEIVKGGFVDAKPVRINSSSLRGVANGDLILRQRAGGGNSLGLVKFRFPNDHAVYFHDTPQKHLFSSTDRAHSHGCMRLEKPQTLAEWVLKEDPDWSVNKIEKAMSYGNRNVATLKENLNVFVVYFTVFPLPDRPQGIAFLKDVYGRDSAALGELFSAND